MASVPVAAFAAITKFFHKPKHHPAVQPMLDDDDRFNDVATGDYEPFPHPPFHPFANPTEFDHWSPPHTHIHIPDPTATASSSASTVLASSSINLAQGTATRAHPRPPATARAKQGEYIPSHRQQLQPQLAIVTQPSAAAQPVLFDFDMDAEWHQTGAQFEAQQQQQFALNLSLNNPSLSPASSFSSLSPTQVPLPLTPGVPGVPTMPQQLQQQQHGGAPLSTTSMSPTSNNTTPSASTSLPTRTAAYSFPSASPYVPHNSLRRTATSNAMPPSPSSPSQSYHHSHQRHASANGYHPYASNGRYQGHQQQHRRSPLHQQQSSRSSPLGHQPGYVAEDFVDPASTYGGQQMARSQGAVQGGYPVQQQGYAFEQQSIQKQYPQQQSYPFPTQQQQQQQPRLSPSLYPSPPPSHPHLQHLQRVHIPAYTGPVGHGHGPRSASSSSTSSHVTSNSSNSSASSSSYGPGTPLSVGSSAGSFPSSSSLAGLNLNGNAGNNSDELLTEIIMAGSSVCSPEEAQAAAQQHYVGLSGGMGVGGMGMEVDGILDMDMGMGYMQSQPHQSPTVHSQTTGISPQLVMLDSMPNHIHDQAQQMSSIFDDEPSPIDAAYAEYAAAAAAAANANAGESYVMGMGVVSGSGDDVDPRDSISNLDDAGSSDLGGGNGDGGSIMGGAVLVSSPLTQQRLEQHQKEEQRKAARPAEVTGVVQEWQRMGREYDSADSDSESEEASDEDEDESEDYEEEEGRNGSEGEAVREVETPLVASPERQAGARRGGKTKASNARGSTGTANSTGMKTPTARPASKAHRQAPSSFRRAVPTKRASTRTITPATIKTSRSRASTQTLTQKNVRNSASTGQQDKQPASTAVDMGEADGEIDAEGEADLDAEGEEDVGEGEMDVAAASGEDDAVGESDGVLDSAAEDDDEMSTDESSEYDDDKDGEFVLRPRSRSRPSASRAPRRESASSARRGAGGRALRTRTSSGNGSASGRYNPYSAYANDQASSSSASANSAGGAMSASAVIAGLRTLSGVVSGGAPSSPTLSSSSLSNAGDVGSSKQRKARPPTNLPVPVPVPNLTKKSRGRRVPTVGSLEELRKVSSTNESASTSGTGAGTSSSGSGRGRRKAGAASSSASTGTKGARMYLCDVEGCGKCFARGEHLKRHVRSIHTNEKPHTCPYPGCGKDFSRHDNLGQHMRVHKDYVPPPSAKAPSS